MTNPIDPILNQLRNQLVEASTADIERIINEARQDALAEFKQFVKARLFDAVFEVAQDLPLEPASVSPATPSGDGLLAAEDLEADATAAPAVLETPDPMPVFDDEPAPDKPEPMQIEETGSSEDAPAAETEPTESVFEPVHPHDLLLDGEEEMDPEILQEIETIRKQISKNEQLLSQLKPFFRSNEGGHA